MPPQGDFRDRQETAGAGGGGRRCHASQLAAARQDLLNEIEVRDAQLARPASMLAWLRAMPLLRVVVAFARRVAGRFRSRPGPARPAEDIAGPGPVAAAANAAPTVSAHAPRLRIAGIVDEFTELGLGPDCELRMLGIDTWQRELEAFRPDLLFVESAWKGNGGQWRDKLVPVSRELHGVLEWCGRHAVPTVFWNKEDPTHFDHFLASARHFDFIYTTAAECVPRYRSALARDAVGLLPFACQPRAHNPVETGARKNAACFPGTYYNRYAERQADFDRLVDALEPFLEIDIFDRNHRSGIEDFAYPERYRARIQAGVPADRVVDVYKGYRFAVNLNTVKDSRTMFSRRVLELLACNTVTLSNPSDGMQRLFGDLVVVEGPGFAESRLEPLIQDEGRYRRHRLAGLRKVMAEHTWSDRVAQLSREVLGQPVESAPPMVFVVARARSQAELSQAAAAFARQGYPHKQLVLVLDRGQPGLTDLPDGAIVLAAADAEALMPAEKWPGGFLAGFSGRDYYGPDYLLDMALGFRFCADDMVGKACHYRWGNGGAMLVDDGAQYRPSSILRARCGMVRNASLELSVAEWVEAVEAGDAREFSGLALDEFGYCRDAEGKMIPEVDSQLGIDPGITLEEFAGAVHALSHPGGARP